ncbi:MAG: filamentous hemagglutinin N-terminal domain-containing protein, partial [Pseudomonadota bacterium]
MNHCYRLVFNKSTQVWQVVSEIAKSHSKSAAIVLLPILSIFSNINAWADTAQNALPTGGQVVSGQSTITQNANQLNIVQGTQKSIINWNTYNIGANAQVNYQQTNDSAISLNRVTSGNPSEIFGKLNANGQVWLINPNGVLFGKSAQVNVGGIVASTLNIADEDFLNGKYQFTGNAGSVVNMGSIVASNGGYVAMLAPEVRNEGVISAMQGTVAMAAGNAMTLDFNGNGLINVQVDSASVNTLVENKHLIQVGNGQVLMSAKAADGLITSVINNSGKIEANSMINDGGVIRLAGAKTVINSGEISATSASQKGGIVHLLGDHVGVFDKGSIDVSGKNGGGTILVGGDYQGKNANIQNATKTFIDQDATLTADATETGDGGRVIVWADDVARYYGSVSAKGGAISGNGGFVEISGKRLLNFLGNVDLSAANGVGGNLLLDPLNITLSNNDTNTLGFTAGSDNTQAFTEDAGLNSVFNVGSGGSFSGISAGSTITLQATNDIIVASAFNVFTATGSVNNNLVLEANRNIKVDTALTLDGTGALTIKADADGNSVGDVTIDAAIITNTGGVNLSGANVTGTAAGSITTTGAADGSGGNVNISAKNAINIAAAINTTAGLSSNGTAGRHAGNITLTTDGAISVNSITANGGSAVGTGSGSINQSGGNAGSISLTANRGISTNSIQAVAGNGSSTNGNGGNSGSIVIANQDAVEDATGDIAIVGTLRISAGSGSGTGLGGTASNISITNQANVGNIATANLDTKGLQKTNSGNISIASEGNVTVTGTIDTSPNNAAAEARGTHAGNVTIVGVNRTITGAVTANGGRSIFTENQFGGNAGVVSITGTGTLSTAAISARVGLTSGTGIAGLAGSVILSGSQVTTTAIDTSPIGNGIGGSVNIITTGGGDSTIASINAENFGAININNSDRLTVIGVIQGTGAIVTKSGTGSLIYAGENTYTGGTVVEAGVLQIGNGATGGSLVATGGVINDATVVFNRSNAHAYAGVISGTGIVEKDGAGEFTFAGGNTYSGATNIKTGTLKSSSAISNVSAVNISSGATLDLNNLNEIVGSIAGAGQIVMGTADLTSGGNNASTLFSGTISGTNGSFNKTGTGTLTLSGNNTYTGVTNVQDGTLSVAHANALGTVTNGTNVASGKTLNVNDVALAAETITLANIATLTGTDAAIVTGTVSAGDNSQLGTTSAASTLSINGVLTSATGRTLEIIGAGSLIASNAANNVDIVKITNAKDVTLQDADSIRFAATASNLTGNLTVDAAANISLQIGSAITSSIGDIVLTSNAFINNAGANALTATDGRWIVHTSNVADNTYGGLASSNQAIWGRALGEITSEAGDRYVFVQSPTLDITSTDQNKTYGQDAASLVASAFTATTFVNAVTYGNVFTQDTIANALSGSATSAGSIMTANVGDYVIDVMPITATTGYTLNKSNTGNLTVNAAVINLAGTRIYNGATAFNAAVFGTIAGVNGEELNITGAGSVASKNAGSAQTLVLGSLALEDVSDASASNYTLATGTHTGVITAATLNLSAV